MLTVWKVKHMTLKAIIIHEDDSDVYQLVRMGCAEAKKSLGVKHHVKPVDYIKRPYGHIIVVQYNNEVYGSRSGVRARKTEHE